MPVEKNLRSPRKTAPIRLVGGLDENSPVTALPNNKFVTMENWRVAEDGLSIEKVNGVAEVSGVNAAIGAKDVYGYATYWDSDSNFCQLLVTDEKIWRKVGSGSWTALHTWSSTLAHPVKIHEVQDKIIICSEIQNRMILTNGAGSLVQLGITAPATVPTLATSAQTGAATDPLDDAMAYADQAAMDAVWTDGDSGATSTLSTSDPNSVAGPDADSKYMRFNDSSPATSNYARRSKYCKDIGSEYILELDIHFDDAGYEPQDGDFEVKIYNGNYLLELSFSGSYVYLHNGVQYETIWKPPADQIRDRWWNFKFDVTASKVKMFVDGVEKGSLSLNRPNTTTPGLVQITLHTGDATYGNGDVYIDHIKILNKGGGSEVVKEVATYRYAITYARNTGNYPGESNPIKSLVGAAAFVGSGLNDLTSGGTYTGSVDRTFWVRVDGTGATDTIEYSDDAGETWKSTDLPMTTKMYIGWGVELNFNATTGHTATDYWTIACKAIAIATPSRQITLASIPTSSDAQVNQRKIYRTTANGTRYYLLAIINDNTTTTFVDNIPDSMLGAEMDEDNDVAPLGKYSEWWDDRLWIYDADENIVYYSKINKPDQFDESDRYVSVRKGKVNDEGTGMIPYQGHMFTFKHDSMFMIRKQAGGYYGRYEVEGANGCIAPWSLAEVNGLLTWVSYRGWEVFNGQSSYIPEFTLPVVNTLLTIDKTNAAYMTACQLRSKFEIMLSIPDRTGGNSAVTVIFNIKAGAFSTRTFSKVPSCLVESRDSSKELQTYMGTRDGYLGTVNSGTQSFGTSITATGRTGWIDFGREVRIRKVLMEYEGPDSGSITVATFADFQVTAKNTHTWTTYYPDTATDRSIRLPYADECELNVPGRYFSFKFTNSANIGSQIKINSFQIEYQDDRTRREKGGD